MTQATRYPARLERGHVLLEVEHRRFVLDTSARLSYLREKILQGDFPGKEIVLRPGGVS